ncbi:hypothetical protein HanIR_Chr08g0368651 [Helianthus annuus]|nr:hypothetical protein HanIR_Chr08g0368651 [Helianthus annuus]
MSPNFRIRSEASVYEGFWSTSRPLERGMKIKAFSVCQIYRFMFLGYTVWAAKGAVKWVCRAVTPPPTPFTAR